MKVVESGAKCLKVFKNPLQMTGKEAKTMLSGEFRHSIDPKNRLFIPAKHREELGDTFMVVRSIRENCLQVYSSEEWESYIAPIRKMERRDSERILRTLHRNAAQVSPDSQGRIVLTPSLIEHASIAKGAVVVGCGAYAEIWAEEVYDAKLLDEDLDDIRATLESFGL
jgi:MraZ protein